MFIYRNMLNNPHKSKNTTGDLQVMHLRSHLITSSISLQVPMTTAEWKSNQQGKSRCVPGTASAFGQMNYLPATTHLCTTLNSHICTHMVRRGRAHTHDEHTQQTYAYVQNKKYTCEIKAKYTKTYIAIYYGSSSGG